MQQCNQSFVYVENALRKNLDQKDAFWLFILWNHKGFNGKTVLL